MKPHIISTNWRVHLLGLLAIAALILFCGENNNLSSFLIAKSLAVLLVVSAVRLYRRWSSQGKIDELTQLADDE